MGGFHNTPYFLNASVELMPASISLRTRFSAPAFSRARSMTSPSRARGMITTPSRSPKTRSPGSIQTPSISIGMRKAWIEVADARVLGEATGAEHRPVLLEHLRGVAVRTVDHGADAAAGAGGRGEDFAPQRGAHAAAADPDLSGANLVECLGELAEGLLLFAVDVAGEHRHRPAGDLHAGGAGAGSRVAGTGDSDRVNRGCHPPRACRVSRRSGRTARCRCSVSWGRDQCGVRAAVVWPQREDGRRVADSSSQFLTASNSASMFCGGIPSQAAGRSTGWWSRVAWNRSSEFMNSAGLAGERVRFLFGNQRVALL